VKSFSVRRKARPPHPRDEDASTGWLSPEQRQRPVTLVEDGFIIGLGRLEPEEIIARAAEASGATGIRIGSEDE
jgi:hypothetical protein